MGCFDLGSRSCHAAAPGNDEAACTQGRGIQIAKEARAFISKARPQIERLGLARTVCIRRERLYNW